MDSEEIRPFILEYLDDTQDKQLQFLDVITGVLTRLAKGGFLGVGWKDAERDVYWRSSDIFDDEREKIREILWDFLFLRIISPGINEITEHNANLPFFHLTDYGKKVVAVRELQPHDPDGYLTFFKREIPDLDEEIEKYLAESLQAYRRELLFSSAVTLGAASEKALILLMEKISDALVDKREKNRYAKLQDSIRTKKKFDETLKILLANRKKLPRKIQENIESELQGVFNLIRVTRNDSGHPTGKTLRRDEVFMNLRLFYPHCKKVYQLIGWLKNNQL